MVLHESYETAPAEKYTLETPPPDLTTETRRFLWSLLVFIALLFVGGLADASLVELASGLPHFYRRRLNRSGPAPPPRNPNSKGPQTKPAEPWRFPAPAPPPRNPNSKGPQTKPAEPWRFPAPAPPPPNPNSKGPQKKYGCEVALSGTRPATTVNATLLPNSQYGRDKGGDFPLAKCPTSPTNATDGSRRLFAKSSTEAKFRLMWSVWNKASYFPMAQEFDLTRRRFKGCWGPKNSWGGHDFHALTASKANVSSHAIPRPLKIVVGMPATTPQCSLRNVHRETWMSVEYVCDVSRHADDSCSVFPLFLFANIDPEQVERANGMLALNHIPAAKVTQTWFRSEMEAGRGTRALWLEAQAKTVAWFKYAAEQLPWATHIAKMDTDTLPFWPAIMDDLLSVPSTTPLYYGKISIRGGGLSGSGQMFGEFYLTTADMTCWTQCGDDAYGRSLYKSRPEDSVTSYLICRAVAEGLCPAPLWFGVIVRVGSDHSHKQWYHER